MKLVLPLLVLAALARAQDVLFSLPISVDGAVKNLNLHRGETVERAAVAFMELNGLIENGLESERSQNLIQQLAGMLRERAEPPKDVFLTFPLSIDGSVKDIVLYKNEAPVDAVARFLRDTTFSEDVKTEMHPQILELLTQRVREALPKPQITFDVTIDGKAATVEHFEGQDPRASALAFGKQLGITDENFLARLVPQVAGAIQQRLDELVPPPAPRAELFSLPLNVNGAETLLVHYVDSTPAESALVFLQEQGLADAGTVDTYLPQLVAMIDREIAARTARTPLFSVPITIGSISQPLEYFEGDSAEVTAQLFLEKHGLTQDPAYASLLEQLATVVLQQEREAAAAAAVTANEAPLFNVPLNVGGSEISLPFYARQDPASVAADFCTSQLPGADAEATQQCKIVLFQTITGILEKLAAESQPSETVEPQPPAVEEPATPALLVTLDIDLGDGVTALLQYFAGDDADAAARAFCEHNGVDLENVPLLADEIRRQVAKL
uniref:Secreted protein n=1 Tax=Achlya hypogyna TaxID=1202772 RepID=A0A0A7CNB6_ACHHY|nr:secreted protein [Achlya hypogyna]